MGTTTKNRAERIIEIVSILSAVTGLAVGILYIAKNIVFGREIRDTEMKITGIFLAVGLLGSSLDFVLKKYLSDMLKDYISSDKISGLISAEVNKVKVEELKQEEDAHNETIESDQSAKYHDLNTVIVPVAKTYEQVKQEHEYRCPANNKYTFKNGLTHIAFYLDKEIIGYAELKPGYPRDINGERVFAFDELHKLAIPHKKKYAFIQKKMYCNIEKLKNARDTSEIRA